MFFVGAGASVDPPSGLPLFGSLAKKLAGIARVPYDANVAIDYFLGSMPAGFDTHAHTRGILTDGRSEPNSTHTALVRLAATIGPLRIVTTNFDDHLSSAAASEGILIADKWVGPALPLGDDFEGLVHLHGSVLRHPRELVLTDQDFGRAYLTAAWATRFLLPMFQRFTVVFVGYSHDDPIMRYLALGLPSGTPRFVITSTDSANDLKWARLGVQPVAYPVTGTDHSALVRALQAWDARARMRQLDHSARIQEIVAAGPVLTPVDSDYLIDRLLTNDGARDFARTAAGVSDELKIDWLRWLENDAGFRQLFASAEVPDAVAILGNWFCRTFLTVPELHGAALQTVQRLGQSLSGALFGAASMATNELAAQDPASGRRWKAFLATSVFGLTAPPRTDLLLPSGPEGQAIGLPLLRLALRPFLVLKRRWFVVEEETPAAVPEADVAWNVDEYVLTQLVASLVGARPPGEQSLGLVLEEALNSAYDLLEDYRGESAWDSLSFRRSAIEPHQQDEIREPIDAIVDGLRDYGERARLVRPGVPERWWRFGRPLFQRIALHLIATDPVRSADEKIEWVLDRDLLFAANLKHETYQVLGGSIIDASDGIRVRVLEAVRRGPGLPADTPDLDEHVAYSRYNLLVWLTEKAPEWVDALTELKSLHEEYPAFGRREHPDLDSWVTTGTWGGKLPMDPEEFAQSVRADASGALGGLLARDYSERTFDEPEWDDALSLVAQVVGAEPELGVALWSSVEAVGADGGQQSDLRTSVVSGWSRADLHGISSKAVELASRLVGDPAAAHVLGRFLLEQVRKRIEDEDDAALAGMRALATALWHEHASTFTHAEDANLLSIAPLYLNSWPGSVALYWMSEVDRRWRKHRDDWAGLNNEERSALTELLSGPPHALDATRPALSSQLFFLFSADADFTTAHVLPLFQIDETSALVWDSYLHHPRYNDRLLAAGLLEATIAQWDRLEAIGGDALQQQFLGVVSSIASFAGITNEQRQDLLDQSVLAQGGAYAARFAEAVVRFLRADGVEGNEVWKRWLGQHVRNRLEGIPRDASEEELACWADVVPYVGDSIPDAIALFGPDPVGIGDRFLPPTFPPGALSGHGRALVEHFARRVRNAFGVGSAVTYRVRQLVNAIRSELGDVAVLPLVEAAKANGLMD